MNSSPSESNELVLLKDLQPLNNNDLDMNQNIINILNHLRKTVDAKMINPDIVPKTLHSGIVLKINEFPNPKVNDLDIFSQTRKKKTLFQQFIG